MDSVIALNDKMAAAGADAAPSPSSAETRAKVWLTLAMWGSSFIVFTLMSFLDPREGLLAAAGMRTLLTMLGIAFCYGLHCLLRSMASRSFATRAVTLSIAAPVVAEIFAWLNYFGFTWLYGWQLAFVVDDWNAAIRQLLLFTWFFIAWTGLYLAIEYSFRAREEQRRAAELSIHAHRAKLEALSNQINPHFLFNSLNSISALVLDGKDRDADRALCHLSAFFRETLCLNPIEDVPLSRELELYKAYLAVEQLRYPDMDLAFDLPDALCRAAVPALILQPLVENAIKHGIARSDPPTCLRISASEREQSLILVVANAGRVAPGAPQPEGQGIGLANVRNRLRERFGADHRFLVRPLAGGFEVELSFPLEFI